jgi:hypothetical protein
MEQLTVLQGGAILKTPSISRCQAIVNMTGEASSKLDLLTYRSNKGFIFTLDVADQTKALFKYWNYLSEPDIQDYLIKLVIVTQYNDDPLPAFNGIDKSSESMDSFFREAKIQSRVWELSTLSSRPNFTPCVIDFSLFNRDNGSRFLGLLKSKIQSGSRGDDVIDYLMGLIQDPTYTLGLLVMPFLHKSEKLNEYIARSNVDNRINMYIDCLAKVISLYLFNGLMHYDLHQENILVKRQQDGTYSPFVIDFGRSSQVDLLNPAEYFQNDEFLLPAEQQASVPQRSTFRDRFIALIMPGRRENAKTFELKQNEFMSEVIQYLKTMDHTINHRMFAMANPTDYQMDWIEDIISQPNVDVKNSYLQRIWSIVLEDNMISDVGTRLSTIQRYKKENKLINFVGAQPTSFFCSPTISAVSASAASAAASAVSSPSSASSSLSRAKTNPPLRVEPDQQCDEDSKGNVSGCSMMGGRRKKRSTQKYQKNRKTSKRN